MAQNLMAGLLLLGLIQTGAWAQDAAQQRLGTPSNQSSQRYEINQTFDGRVFRKDQSVWAYNKEFADLFCMPAKYIEAVQGVAAVAFRIEDRNIVECGYGGKESNCRKIEDCVLDLYFDESKTPLPWATDIKSQWLPRSASMIWLRPLDRKEKPYGMDAPDTPEGVLRNKSLSSPIVAFADPLSKIQAIFVTNANVGENSGWDMSGVQSILGYTRNFYRGLSIVNLQMGCQIPARKTFELRLESKVNGAFDKSIASFNKIFFPVDFVRRMNDALKINSDRNAIFYRNLFPSSIGTAGQPASALNATSN